MKNKNIGYLYTFAIIIFAVNNISAQQEGSSPLKVFILAGQSNMQGHGRVEYIFENGNTAPQPNGTIDWLIAHPDHGPEFKHLKDNQGNFTIRNDVWVAYKRNNPPNSPSVYGPLEARFGVHGLARSRSIGPELGIGWVLGDVIDNQLLLIKTAWGGKNVTADFLPPSKGGPGPFYTQMIDEVDEVLSDIKSFFPDYDGQGYEIVGFQWNQGWNDRGNDQYEDYMLSFIADIRKEYNNPVLPFVIAETGNTCPNVVCEQQALVGDTVRHPEFAGNVSFVPTQQFNDPDMAPWGTQYGSHWHGSMWSYYKIGEAMGNAMVSMLDTTKSVGLIHKMTHGPSMLNDHGVLILKFADKKSYTLNIYSIKGDLIYTKEITEKKMAFNLGLLPSGVFRATVHLKNKVILSKSIVMMK